MWPPRRIADAMSTYEILTPNMSLKDVSPLIEFAPGTSLYRERDFVSQLSILRNGQAGAFVVFSDGLRVSLPTD